MSNIKIAVLPFAEIVDKSSTRIHKEIRKILLGKLLKPNNRKQFDDVILEAGGFGRYQIIFMLIFGTSRMMADLQLMTIVFLFDTPKFRCASHKAYDHPYDNNISTSYDNASLSPHDGSEYSTCQSYGNRSDWETSNGNHSSVRPRESKEDKCTSWIYDTSDYTSTVVSEFNLVCERKIFGSHAKMVFFAGHLIGSVILGLVSDEFGRRTGLTLSVVLVASSGIGISFAPTFRVLIAMLFFNGVAIVGLLIFGFVIVMEFTTPDKRVRPCMLYFLFDPIGAMYSIPLAYWLRSWRNLQLATLAPCFAFLILFTWWLPESGRWLLSKGHVERAEKEVFKMARYNGVTLPSGFNLRNVVLDKRERRDWRSVIKSRTLCNNIAITCLNWFSLGMTFSGITLHSVYLSGNRFINTFAMTAANLPLLAMVYFSMDRVGRKRIHCILATLGGTVIIGSIVPVFVRGDSLQVLTTVLMLLGRLFVSQAFQIVYYMTTEMFPTNVRGIVIGFASLSARVGAMIAPYVIDLGVTIDETYGPAFSPIVFGILTTVSGLLTLCLPSTDKEHLPETTRDVETLGQRKVDQRDVEQAERRRILPPESNPHEKTTL